VLSVGAHKHVVLMQITITITIPVRQPCMCMHMCQWVRTGVNPWWVWGRNDMATTMTREQYSVW
jgi:hypothetical protein